MLTAEELAPLLVECSEHEGLLSEEDIRRVEAPLNAERCLAIAELAGRPRRVLEVGPGRLLLTTAFRALYGDAVELSAVDHPKSRYIGEEWFHQQLAHQRVELRMADIVRDPFPFDGGFDAVLFCGVIEHQEPTAVLDLLGRLRDQVADGGRLIISSTNLAAFVRLASLAFGHGEVMAPPITRGWWHGHLRLYTRSDMEVLVDSAGMRMVEWRYLNCERVYIGRAGVRGKLLYAGQVAAPKLVPHMATSWVCSAALS